MTTASPQPRRALLNPQADFWLLSGLSILGLIVISLLTSAGDNNAPWSQQIIWLFGIASFIVNQPHFAYSYQLFYGDFSSVFSNPQAPRAYKLRFFIAGVAVPVLLLMFIIFIGVTHSTYLLGCGLYAFMFLSGWHYVKQGYGVLITTSVYKAVFYSLWQKRILYANAYFLWLYAWVRLNDFASRAPPQLYGVPLAVTHFSAVVQKLSRHRHIYQQPADHRHFLFWLEKSTESPFIYGHPQLYSVMLRLDAGAG